MPVSEYAFSLHAEKVTQKTMLVIPRMNQTAFRKGHVKTCHEVSNEDGLTRLKNGGTEQCYCFHIHVKHKSASNEPRC